MQTLITLHKPPTYSEEYYDLKRLLPQDHMITALYIKENAYVNIISSTNTGFYYRYDINGPESIILKVKAKTQDYIPSFQLEKSYKTETFDLLLEYIPTLEINTNPSYVRETSWVFYQKQQWLDYLFQSDDPIDIKIHEHKDSNHQIKHDIIDGKIRMDIINEFLNNQLKYHGYYFKELQLKDQIFIKQKPVKLKVYKSKQTDKIDKVTILKLYLGANGRKTQPNEKHINTIKKSIEKLEKLPPHNK